MLKPNYVFYKAVPELLVDGWGTFPFLSFEEIAYCVIILSDFWWYKQLLCHRSSIPDGFIHSYKPYQCSYFKFVSIILNFPVRNSSV